ncbi:hypothetical protein Avbf_09647 [Armadillidium vulgare]|nr:hypothetical protein Avbf_09647 [Armadillidium vulgare]
MNVWPNRKRGATPAPERKTRKRSIDVVSVRNQCAPTIFTEYASFVINEWWLQHNISKMRIERSGIYNFFHVK